MRRFSARALVAVCFLTILSGCAANNVGPKIQRGADAYALIPVAASGDAMLDYRIGPLDTLQINVFQEADISSSGTVVDASGNLSMPLIGRVQASGRTAPELADQLAAKLAERFYVDPQVSVTVISSVAQRVTVQGEVEEPGIYPISGGTTLLDTIALAKGETDNAALREAIVIRYVDGKRMGAVFDLKAIRRGDQQDPAILARDTVILGHSNSKRIWHDVLRAAPLLNVFAQF